MYIQDLNRQEQKVLLQLLQQLMKVDGTIAQEEDEQFMSLLRACEVELSELAEPGPLATLCSKVADEKSKRMIVTELIGMAYEEGIFDESERKFIDEVRQHFGLSEETLDQIEFIVSSLVTLFSSLDRIVKEVA